MNKYDIIIFKAEHDILIQSRLDNNKVTGDLIPFVNPSLYNSLTESTLVIGNLTDDKFKEVMRVEVKNQKNREVILHKSDNVFGYINSILENINND